MTTPTLLNLPPPPSDPVTPSDIPGTPNSGTTSLSALSTVAIKDGHQGHPIPHGHHHNQSTGSNTSATTLDAERADRISRLAGLERVATLRGQQQSPSVSFIQPPGYAEGLNPLFKERSTVGSASATGSVGGRTTWADSSDAYDHDKMSEDPDEISSTSGFSDEGNASLVGFGEGANSTVSGPISTAAVRAQAARQNSLGSASRGSGPVPQHVQHQSSTGSPMYGIATTPTPPGSADPRMMDGVSYDANVVDTTTQGPIPTGQHSRNISGGGAEIAERVLRDRIGSDDGSKALESPDGRSQTLGKFPFEKQ